MHTPRRTAKDGCGKQRSPDPQDPLDARGLSHLPRWYCKVAPLWAMGVPDVKPAPASHHPSECCHQVATPQSEDGQASSIETAMHGPWMHGPWMHGPWMH